MNLAPFDDVVSGIKGSLQVVYITSLDRGRLIAAACWVNREAFPDQPLFNPESEGCLPMDILVAESKDEGRSWTQWRRIPLPDDVGPASLTNPVLRLPSGRLAISIETNKTYHDTSPWKQRVVYVYSGDKGQSWSEPVTICEDPAGTLFFWDQRAAVTRDGALVTFSWTYHKPENRYLKIRRRISRDEGRTWTEPKISDSPISHRIPPFWRMARRYSPGLTGIARNQSGRVMLRNLQRPSTLVRRSSYMRPGRRAKRLAIRARCCPIWRAGVSDYRSRRRCPMATC